MAVTSRGRTTDLQLSKKWKERETSPERTKVWTQPPNNHKPDRKVPVVYYLSRNGQLEHPHFIEVPLSSSEGLYLRDVINRLNFLRGKGMALMYSWSSKRSYKNGFVWHDLAENDFICPTQGREYVLKGSELLEGPLITKSDETVPEIRKPGGDCDFSVATRGRNQSWNAIDFQEYKVYKAESTGRAAADVSTQTDEKRRRRRSLRGVREEEEEDDEREEKSKEPYQNRSTELCRDEISPPPSDTSPETLESLVKGNGKLAGGVNDDPAVNNHHPKVSSVLMQLISCGSISFKDCGPTSTYGKEAQGFSLISHYKSRLPRGGGSNQVGKDVEKAVVENPSFGRRVKLEDKDYFSGSLIETKNDEFCSKRSSSSYNAARSSQLDLMEKEIGVRVSCMPSKQKTQSTKREGNSEVSLVSCNSSKITVVKP